MIKNQNHKTADVCYWYSLPEEKEAGKNEKKNISTYIKCIDDNELYSVQEGR